MFISCFIKQYYIPCTRWCCKRNYSLWIMRTYSPFKIGFTAIVIIAVVLPFIMAKGSMFSNQSVDSFGQQISREKLAAFLKMQPQKEGAADDAFAEDSQNSSGKNYELQAGTLFEDFESLDDWVVQGEGLAKEAEGTFVKSGKQSLKLTLSPTVANQAITKTINANLEQAGTMALWIYCPSVNSFDDSWLSIYLSSTPDFAKYFTFSLSTQLHEGWNKLIIPRSSWINNSDENWNNPMVRFQFRLYGNNKEPNVIYLDNITFGSYSRPKILINFDDGFKSSYEEGYKYLKSKNMKSTIYIIGSQIDGPSYMTQADLKSYYNEGNDLGNHSYSHINMATLGSQAEMEEEISYGRAFLDSQGFTRASDHFAYPNGSYNPTVLAAVKAQNVKTARTVIKRIQANELDNRYLLTMQLVTDETTLEATKMFVDRVIDGGGSFWFNFHKLVENPTANTEWKITDFRALVDYIAKKRDQGLLDVVTVSEWYNGLGA